MKKITTEITIASSPETVWEILLDFKAYPAWNPFIKELSGETEIGNRLKATIQPADKKPMTFKPVVLMNEKEKEFRWKGKLFFKGLFDGEHFFQLEADGLNQTRFVHGENFSGMFSGMIFKKIGKATQEGFEAMNVALKTRAEEKATSIGR